MWKAFWISRGFASRDTPRTWKVTLKVWNLWAKPNQIKVFPFYRSTPEKFIQICNYNRKESWFYLVGINGFRFCIQQQQCRDKHNRYHQLRSHHPVRIACESSSLFIFWFFFFLLGTVYIIHRALRFEKIRERIFP